MDWPRILADFEPDGSLRDIYVLGTTRAHWQRLLDGLRRWTPAPTLMLGGEPAAIPERIEEIFAASREVGALLSLDIGTGPLNCHFFVEDEIEFDLDPRDVAGPAAVQALIRFMAFVGEATDKAVVLTTENSREAAILRYCPDRKEVEWIGPPGG
jgi:hypothetical protein